MLDFTQKRKIRGVMYHRITLVVLCIIVLFFIHSTWTVYRKKTVSEEAKNVTAVHLAELEERDRELTERTLRLDTPRGVEDEIRSKFSVVKGGESMVVVVPTTIQPATTTPPTGFWQKIKSFFFR